MTLASQALSILDDLRIQVDRLDFGPPVTHVYDPLGYARPAVRQYLERYGDRPKRVLFVGMNPGPWGMAQTGVPFGEVAAVRDWLGLDAEIGKPSREHPRRPVEGLACRRHEVSGRRLWGFFADRFGTPERFFADHLVLNHCPLVFLEATGRNRTPVQLPAAEREPLLAACDEALAALVDLYRPRWCVGVGAYAEARLRAVCGGATAVGRLLHPSPASPTANRGWAEQAASQLVGQGVWRS
ncbi:MAG TPA: single-stranded DNA-binding protein [Candidatus Krumholzibacteria bacterium]|nr:single-stranded DNA-binding protein [Candidatus Krumholzibacteria bacterium]HPD70385.1 single-stranded DNA-binding protein [Candidatus Krumholzibacteria bacterium]HRY39915.1 single-stranded DNA-binding protein [Candidatus Krumholzibacteria bacterium]